jgi:hypothetical protein
LLPGKVRGPQQGASGSDVGTSVEAIRMSGTVVSSRCAGLALTSVAN